MVGPKIGSDSGRARRANDDADAHGERRARRWRLAIEIPPELDRTVDQVLRSHVLAVLHACHHNMGYAARILGVNRKTVSRWLHKWGIAAS